MLSAWRRCSFFMVKSYPRPPKGEFPHVTSEGSKVVDNGFFKAKVKWNTNTLRDQKPTKQGCKVCCNAGVERLWGQKIVVDNFLEGEDSTAKARRQGATLSLGS